MDAVSEKTTFHKFRTVDVLRRLRLCAYFGVNKKELFEYKEQLFGYEHVEKELEEWVRSDPAVAVEGLVLINPRLLQQEINNKDVAGHGNPHL